MSLLARAEAGDKAARARLERRAEASRARILARGDKCWAQVLAETAAAGSSAPAPQPTA